MVYKKPVILTTNKNICGKNIRKALLEKWPFEKTTKTFDGTPIYEYKNIRLVYSEKDTINADHCDKLDTDLLIIGSRHKSASNRPSLLTHVTGNFSDDTSYGGNSKELAFVSTQAIKTSYLSLKKQKETFNLKKFDVSVEATHHGPTNLKMPLLFIEVGSTEKEYNNPKAVLAVAKTIIKVGEKLQKPLTKEIVPSICFGGGHYATRFNELMELTPVAIGHILPKYHRKNLTVAIVKQMIEKTVEYVDLAIIDRSSLNLKLIQKIENGCSPFDIEVVRAKEVKDGDIL
jgi:D-aminoacyl-tRNA deacylase